MKERREERNKREERKRGDERRPQREETSNQRFRETVTMSIHAILTSKDLHRSGERERCSTCAQHLQCELDGILGGKHPRMEQPGRGWQHLKSAFNIQPFSTRCWSFTPGKLEETKSLKLLICKARPSSCLHPLFIMPTYKLPKDALDICVSFFAPGAVARTAETWMQGNHPHGRAVGDP